MPQKKILYLGMKYDYGSPPRGISFEEKNFHETLRRYPGCEVIPFDFVALSQKHGVAGMAERLMSVVKQEKPDLLFGVLFNETVDPPKETMSYITNHTPTVTCLWMCDDHWRFENYSQYWAPHVSYIVTTASSALPKYKALGYGHKVIKSQWACNHYLYFPHDVRPDRDVAFVGQPHSNRKEIIDYLKNRNVAVEVYGWGWANYPRIPFHQMVRLFSRSKVNLNLSNASVGGAQQIKGRNFEIPGCRTFLLTGPADNLEEYYEPGKEIVIFQGREELIEKIRYYLSHEEERRRIAEQSYRRTLSEHTWKHRLDAVFKTIGCLPYAH